MKLRRRHFVGLLLGGLPALAGADALVVEPEWLVIRRLRIGTGPVRHRWVHFTDIHYRGDDAYLDRVVSKINQLAPDFACFTGDLVEEAEYFEPALRLLQKIRAPLFGIPGNHDHWSGADFEPARRALAAGGGAWLQNQRVMLAGGAVALTGVDRLPCRAPRVPDAFNLVLMHYPIWADFLGPSCADLLLAGHSHGGQVRLPGIGALIKPSLTGRYVMGRFDTPSGPLYVNPGIGTFHLDIRFNCRPELTLFEMGDAPYSIQPGVGVV